MATLEQLISTFEGHETARGKMFERACKWLLENDPTYSNLKKVWLWDDWPGRWDIDRGIDLIAEDEDGKIWGIQAKLYRPENSINRKDIDTFLTESSNKYIHQRLLIGTTDNVSRGGIGAMKRCAELIPVNQLLRSELLAKQIEWPESLDKLSTGGLKAKNNPRPDQERAIEDVVTNFKDQSRGQLIMACGTGKTLTALWIAEKLKSETTLVLLPSLLLLSKTLSEWVTQSSEPFSFLPVCSDDSVSKSDDSINYSTTELGFPSTTDAAEIAKFLDKSGRKVIFSTYQSSQQIADAFEKKKIKPFELVIADEAHRCAGKAGADYTTVLDNKAIPAKKRLFMTATPKIFQTFVKKEAEDRGVEVYSMDDEALFGKVFHKLSFGEAIEQKLLTDYQVSIVGIDEPILAEMISKRELVKTDTGIETDAQTIAAHIGLAKAIKTYDLKRIITFHSKVKSADEFQGDFKKVLDWMPNEHKPDGKFITNFVSGAMTTATRNTRLGELGEIAEGKRGILSNARCLSEGVDVPTLDGIAFIDPRNSEIDIVQAVGRAIRLAKGKDKGTIVIPIFISDFDDPEEVLNDSSYKKIWAVINALRAHDENLGIELDNLRKMMGKRGSVGRSEKIHFDLPVTIDAEFAECFSIKLLETTTASWEFWFGLLEEYKDAHGHANPSQSYITNTKYQLGTWCDKNRQNYKKNKLTSEKINRLEALGFIWDLLAQQWEEGFKELSAYKDAHGHANPATNHKTDTDYQLGTWCNTNRTNYKKNKLTSEKINRLEALGFIWDPLAQQWEEGFKELSAYKDAHGHANPSSRYITNTKYQLGTWCDKNRTNYKKNKLTSEKINRLEALGFIWNPQAQQWEQGFKELSAYKDAHGHANPSKSYITNTKYQLGAWCDANRQNYKKNKLTSEKINRLEALGFIWDPLAQQWEEGFKELSAYKDAHGHANPPQSYITNTKYQLGTWCDTNRTNYKKNKLTSEKINRLEALGFIWDPLAQQWEEGFKELSAYKDAHGHANPSKSYITNTKYQLGAWCDTNRQNYKKNKLTSEKINRLEALGFIWDLLAQQWEEGFKELSAYKDAHGHANPATNHKTDTDYQLGAWCNTNRQNYKKNKLTSEKINRLEALGFIWDPLAQQWEEGFKELSAYKDTHGHANPPQSYITNTKYQLGTWCNTNRRNYKKNKLTSEKINRLEALGFKWSIK